MSTATGWSLPRWSEDMQPEVGVLKKLSLAGLAQLSRLRYSWLRFGLASAGCRGLGVHDRPVYTAGLLTADSTEHDEILIFLTKTPASVYSTSTVLFDCPGAARYARVKPGHGQDGTQLAAGFLASCMAAGFPSIYCQVRGSWQQAFSPAIWQQAFLPSIAR